MVVFETIVLGETFRPKWPCEVRAGGRCYYYDEWVLVIEDWGSLRLENGPTVEEAVGLGAKFKRVTF